jgi:hypothetical protein
MWLVVEKLVTTELYVRVLAALNRGHDHNMYTKISRGNMFDYIRTGARQSGNTWTC